MVARPRIHTGLRLGVGDAEDGAGGSQGSSEPERRRRADEHTAVPLGELEPDPVGMAAAVLQTGHRKLGENLERDTGSRETREVVGEHGAAVGSAGDRGVVVDEIDGCRWRQREHGVGAGATCLRAVRVAALAVLLDPVPAITGTEDGSAARTARISRSRSDPVSTAASPVLPQTRTNPTPRLTTWAACEAVASASTSPSGPNRVTRANPSPPNGTSIQTLVA
jgi:hypothetical protein